MILMKEATFFLALHVRFCSRLARCGFQILLLKQLRQFVTSTVNICLSWFLPTGGASLGA